MSVSFTITNVPPWLILALLTPITGAVSAVLLRHRRPRRREATGAGEQLPHARRIFAPEKRRQIRDLR